MRSAVNTVSQVVEVTDVEDIVVTATVLDDETGDHVREIRVSGLPETDSGPALVFTLRLRSGEKAKINVSAPTQEF